ncbi:MAG TPA: hypothetical protein VMO47_05705 [Rhodothermales bacterium]|nr:hypothetical protein [Rhodothermales bacterium]
MIPPQSLDVTVFCALGAMAETQQIALAAMEDIDQPDAEKVFAETLCLVSTATARAAVSAFTAQSDVRNHLSQTLQALPLTLHSYIAGGEVLKTGASSPEGIPDVTADLDRMMDFYNAHLADTGLPDRKSLRHAMILWMGRISPSGLSEHPEARLDRLGLVDRLILHVRLVEAYARNAAAS